MLAGRMSACSTSIRARRQQQHHHRHHASLPPLLVLPRNPCYLGTGCACSCDIPAQTSTDVAHGDMLPTSKPAPPAALQPALTPCETSLPPFSAVPGCSHSSSSSSSSSRSSTSELTVDKADLDAQFMQLALEQARLAASKDEVPVGAVLVASDGHTVLATSHNQCHTTSNPTAHAEMLAIQEAAAKLGAWRLLGCTLYVTLEPCPMCAGAILQSRVSRLVYGARQPRLGADGSWVALFPEQPEQEKTQPTNTWLPLLRAPLAALREAWGAISLSSEPPVRPTGPHPFHASIEVSRGVLVNECSQVVKDFFRGRRRQQQQQQQRQ